jgi:hypothetical protein
VEPRALRRILEGLERTAAEADVRPALALLGGESVVMGEDELHAARRRAMLLLAAGGDPHRELELDGRAVTALADELGTEERLAQLRDGLSSIREQALDLRSVSIALATLLADERLAWRSFACALLAEELE